MVKCRLFLIRNMNVECSATIRIFLSMCCKRSVLWRFLIIAPIGRSQGEMALAFDTYLKIHDEKVLLQLLTRCPLRNMAVISNA